MLMDLDELHLLSGFHVAAMRAGEHACTFSVLQGEGSLCKQEASVDKMQDSAAAATPKPLSPFKLGGHKCK
jgi:hypothetical protein